MIALSRRLPPALEVGETIRLVPGGPPCKVLRVTPGAAYVARRVVRPHPDRAKAAEGATIASTVVEPISRHAFVERLEVTEEA